LIFRFLLSSLLVQLIFLAPNNGFGQECKFKLSGKVLDYEHELSLTHTIVKVNNRPYNTDSAGVFFADSLCAKIHLKITHPGCETQLIYLVLTKDTQITFYLEHDYHQIKPLVLQGKSHDEYPLFRLNSNQIIASNEKSFADMASALPGVSVLKTGNVSKPIIDGLYGNRVGIVDNGVLLNSQQWGNDHAPEIDGLTASSISLIKGPELLSYPSAAISGILVIEKKNIDKDPHLHGLANYTYSSNGRGHNANIILNKGGKIGLRTIITYKNVGDMQTPRYFLTNTSKKELNFSLQAEKSGEKKFWRINYQIFNSNLGILRGAHIGNLTDLSNAINASVPFFTENNFSRNTMAPSQQVTHQTLSLKKMWFINLKNTWSFIYNAQQNTRKEFDIRRGNRTDRPSLSLNKWGHYAELKLSKNLSKNLSSEFGFQPSFDWNNNVAGTGILPLIPNYNKFGGGIFGCLNLDKKNSHFKTSARLDYAHINSTLYLRTIVGNIPKNDKKQFLGASAAAGFLHNFKNQLQIKTDLLYVQRMPGINELYSFGLHQGVSGIEEGNSLLKMEKSLKWQIAIKKEIHHALSVSLESFVQRINGFIYLQPQPDFRLTIRGAFPLFIYQQTNADILGSTFFVNYDQNKNWLFNVNAAWYAGYNRIDKNKLIYIPPAQLSGLISYRKKINYHTSKLEIKFQPRYVLAVNGIEANQDFKAPPPDFFIANLSLALHTQFFNKEMTFGISIDNVFDHSYRDYLNRMRYFADETGRNIHFKLVVNF